MMNDRNSQSRIKPLKAHLMDMMSLLVKNKKIRMNVPNRSYNDVLDRDIMLAIKRIEKEDSALIEMEYPLLEMSMLHGFMGLKSYLLNLYYENTFCHEYDAEELEWLYKTHCANHGYDETGSCFNIYGAVYINALFCDYLKKDYGTLKLTKKDCRLIHNLLYTLSDEEREEILFGCAKRFTYGNLAYNNKAYMKLIPQALTAIKRKNLENFLVVEKD